MSFRCEIGSKGSFKSDGLKNRFCIHTKEKPLNCEICLEVFTRESNLKEHVEIHTKEKKTFAFELRLKALSNNCDLKKNLRTHMKRETVQF